MVVVVGMVVVVFGHRMAVTFFHICGNFVGLDRHIVFRFQNYCQRIPISLFSRFSAS